MLTLPAYQWVRPTTMEQLLSHLSDHAAESLIVAGGTDAVPNLKHRLHEPAYVVHIAGIESLHAIRDEPEGMHLGALVTLTDLAAHATVRRDLQGKGQSRDATAKNEKVELLHSSRR